VTQNSASPAGVPVFSYAGVARGQQYEAWREEFCRRFCQLDAESGAAERIECTVEVTRVGALSFGAAHGTAASFLRTRPLLSDGCDDLVLVTAMAGDVLTVQRGRTVELKPTQVGLMALDDVAECGLSEGGRFTALRIPRAELIGLCREAEDKLSKPLALSPHLRAIVTGYFALCAEKAASLDAISQHMMARHMTELVGLLLRTDADAPPLLAPDGYGAARLQLIQAEVLRRLGDSNLTILSAARQARLTPKQVQRLFGATGVTFSEFVLEQRLLLAHRLLCTADARGQKISAIALNAGFGDLSYFNRSFRRQFGMTPSEWRDAQPIRS
jgi:AraC-like DNA-binding protein